MVAGSVAPPRLDLLNEDLIRSHVQAIWIAETGLKLGRKIPETIDMDGTEPEGKRRPDPALRLRPGMAETTSSPEALCPPGAHLICRASASTSTATYAPVVATTIERITRPRL